jgi:hypothetical protein
LMTRLYKIYLSEASDHTGSNPVTLYGAVCCRLELLRIVFFALYVTISVGFLSKHHPFKTLRADTCERP